MLMLPFIEQAPLYNAFNASIGVEGPNFAGYFINSTVHTANRLISECPSDNQAGVGLWLCRHPLRVQYHPIRGHQPKGITASIGGTRITAKGQAVVISPATFTCSLRSESIRTERARLQSA